MLDIIEITLLTVILGLLLKERAYNRHGLHVPEYGEPSVVIDSCGLIDGRIVELVEAGFLTGRLIVPKFILHELQRLADGKDAHKRERARQGLEAAHQLKAVAQDSLMISDYLIDDVRPVDDRLVDTARKYKARLYTTDGALAHIAGVHQIKAVNINHLAMALRPAILPGETFSLLLQQKGNGQNQAVGYTKDGTMVVVDDARQYVGKAVEVVAERMHQTAAGKMLFASLKARPTKDTPLNRLRSKL